MKVGIDFGTSTSEIAYVDEKGKIVVIPNHLGEAITPSIVYIQEDNTVLVGTEAREKALIDPNNAFIEVKRMFGQDIVLIARGKAYKPVDIAKIIIEYLVGCAEKFSGQSIDSAVITVPAYFTDSQRREVMTAGKLAGLSVDRIINEPTAASLDYGIRHMSDCNHILVYDLGGGTLDVTVLELFEGVVEVKSSSGNNTLGGKDFDQALMNHMTTRIIKSDKIDITKDPRAMMRLKMAAQHCKENLSIEDDYSIELPFLYTKNDKPKAYSHNITRKDFEDLIKPLILSTSEQIDTALSDANLTEEDIDMVLLVGGSTRIPLVTSFLSDIFGEVTGTSVDPDLAVVRGAAIQAGVLSGIITGNDAIVLTDVCPYSLSTSVLKTVDMGFFSDHIEVCDILIPKNRTLPASFSKSYTTASDNQTEVHISAYQGEGEFPEENELLNKFVLSGIPKARAGKEDVNISFEYDLNGILDIKAQIISTGKTAQMRIDTALDIDLENWKKAPLAKIYRNTINKAARKIKLDADLAEELERPLEQLKRALVLEWDEKICNSLADELLDILEEL